MKQKGQIYFTQPCIISFFVLILVGCRQNSSIIPVDRYRTKMRLKWALVAGSPAQLLVEEGCLVMGEIDSSLAFVFYSAPFKPMKIVIRRQCHYHIHFQNQV